MASTIFYSWQSDLPDSTNKDFLESVLEQSIKALAEDDGLDELELDERLKLDKDTKEVPGSPPIVDVILKKISDCEIFVPDLSFVGTTEKGKLLPNPNVLIEYGWALSEVGHLRIVPIINTEYGDVSAEALPFDMRHLRHPLQYSLATDATPEVKAKVEKNLIDEVTTAIRLALKHRAETPSSIASKTHSPIPWTTDPSTFLEKGEKLSVHVNSVGTYRNLSLPSNQHMYLRIQPVNATKPLSNAKQAKDLLYQGGVQPLCNEYGQLSYSRNERGAFVVRHHENNILGLTQLFLNKELWGIDCRSIDKKSHMDNARVNFDSIPSALVEYLFNKTLDSYLKLCREKLELQPPLKLIAGMTGVKDYKMGVLKGTFSTEKGWLEKPAGHVIKDNIDFECLVEDLNAKPSSILLPFFQHVWEECGLTRLDQENLS